MPRRPRTELAALVALLCAGPALAAGPEIADLRDLRVGMPVSEISPKGYGDLACREGPARTLAGWSDWRACPADATGKRAIGFAYADGTTRNGTRVAGHPARLTLLVGEEARVDGLVIETDDAVPLYLRKKGHLLGIQARGHWGDDGWTCTEGKPTGDEAPLGETFVKEECRKSLSGKSVTVTRDLYGHQGADPRAFISRTRIVVAATR
ncbi:hypothetical protein DA075_03070 [Methylobacterium currus]|uniref:Uncharacterized protein n=1 Tax=Methylobacterium currus TaxID=2051553 RepID=A0A2R4WER4_9HYPH|nr:hypothetical protein [Methylobacterium currus]AWB20041.1 hypothetical protein DA075_03070 [Methylobacterium currus]UHC15227.1 hypothetical protein LRS73_22290 [Methylobacterium currus]